MVKLMKGNPALNLEIQGPTDSTGSAQHNLQLSERRAETVQAFLRTYGIAVERMVPKGYGASTPVDGNDTEEGRSMNRRVELLKLN